MEKTEVLSLMRSILERQSREPSGLEDPSAPLNGIPFRSLDFSELCLRVEQKIGRELNFDASTLRNLRTVEDVCDFILQASRP